MRFMDSYKRLEKLCGDVMGDDRRVSAYIDEMLRLPRGAGLVVGWNDDLKKLKHYRWVRNQIVHEPACSEETLCEPEDALWLENFYERIMNQTDPLTLYRKATQTHTVPQQRPHAAVQSYSAPRLDKRPAGCAVYLLCWIAAAVLLLI